MAVKSRGEFVINRRLWLTGEAIQKGAVIDSSLLDTQTGLMCCLGQACVQLGVTKQSLDTGTPADVSAGEEGPTTKLLFKAGLLRRSKTGADIFLDSHTADKLMGVNDDESETRQSREEKVSRLFKKIGWSVRFIGKYPNYAKIGL